ncbi:MAG: hypothetical protein Q8R97_03040 [Brevundimonas sp.]|uniref:hypothetical protein n=1 Tax=Brevundimonas sp. TaxID=1871086 RepID=UPI00275471B3|nr:hypothetical protein [Brevundimonas sp.]MDP3400076.1 hypothetical protein [Brevundimonas sp.]MDZ4113914.1 hypothetical protein [Brevundimonas sp.]
MTDTGLADPGPTARLAALRASALAVYRTHDLPTKPGFYRKGPRAKRWTRLADDLDAGARWDLIRAHAPDSGWRYLDRDRLGEAHEAEEVREASRVLVSCTRLETALEGAEGTLADLIDLALSLPAVPPRG